MLTSKQRDVIWAAIDAGLRPRGVVAACDDAKEYLQTGQRPPDVTYAEVDAQWRTWLGRALEDKGVLERAVVPHAERRMLDGWGESVWVWCGTGLRGQCTGLRGQWMPDDPKWYYPTPLLLWGCVEYVRRRRRA